MPQYGKVIAIACVRKHDWAIGMPSCPILPKSRGRSLFEIRFVNKDINRAVAGHTVIMGRKTWQSGAAPALARDSSQVIVLSRNPAFRAPATATLSYSLEHTVKDLVAQKQGPTVFILGGGEIFAEALKLKLVDEVRLYVVRNRSGYAATAFFPSDQFRKDFICTQKSGSTKLKDHVSKNHLKVGEHWYHLMRR